MTYSLIVRPDALDDIAEARDWYDKQEVGLGDKFVDVVNATIRHVLKGPKTYQAGYRGVRAATAAPYPYVIHFRIQGQAIEVLAVIHGHRHPRVWRSRL